MTTVSYEFFPPKTDKGMDSLLETARALCDCGPKFMTVTYGAGGSTRDRTLETALAVAGAVDCPVATHLTYINTPRRDIYALADDLWAKGIRHVVALRGDLPQDLNWPLDPDEEYFQYTSHFVVALKARQDFEVSVGAYPEKHPDAPDLDSDIEALRKKHDAGAARAITQFFFDTYIYERFRDAVRAAGIDIPLCPGLLPVTDYAKMRRFAETCSASVPDWLAKRFESADETDHPKIAADILAAQVEELKAAGVEHFHIYTLNKKDIPLSVFSPHPVTPVRA